MACGCAKQKQSCAGCAFGAQQAGDIVLCQKYSFAPDRAMPQMVRGQVTQYSDGAVRTRADGLCRAWQEQGVAVPA